MLRRLFGDPGAKAPRGAVPGWPGDPEPDRGPAAGAIAAGSWTPGDADETATVREIVARLDAMPPDRARFLAGFAYILSRTAEADLTISDVETREMEQILVEHGNIPEAQAVIVVQIAKTRSALFGATEDYLVTREFRAVATDDECLDLLRCCYLVGAADGTITAEESGTLSSIADELGIDAVAVRALRAEYADKFTAIQAMRRNRAG